ncbi:hypothetical protein ACFQT0_06585 [Hymenobacter humi]|uniref:Secreted protein n=1 Tax=Hymenobacter humi TaxID=1411620 RepID=A0ABW2U0X9_9BACT
MFSLVYAVAFCAFFLFMLVLPRRRRAVPPPPPSDGDDDGGEPHDPGLPDLDLPPASPAPSTTGSPTTTSGEWAFEPELNEE